MHVLYIWGMCRESSSVTLQIVQGHFFLFFKSQNVPPFSICPYFLYHVLQLFLIETAYLLQLSSSVKRLRSYIASNIDLQPQYLYLIRPNPWLDIPHQGLFLVGNLGFSLNNEALTRSFIRESLTFY